jgi:hypothetical protein
VSRLVARLRTSRVGFLHRRGDELGNECGLPWTTTFATTQRDDDAERVSSEWFASKRPAPGADVAVPAASEPVPAADAGVAQALARVAEAFERIAESLELERHERAARLDTVETLVRELLARLALPTAVPPVVVGGSIDLSDPSIEVDQGGR